MQFTNNIKSIAIGSFDGIHLAHKTLIEKAEAIIIIERNGGYLTPGFKRSYFTSKICCFYHFDNIKTLSPDAFVDKLKNDFPALETIIVGYDFHFGKNKVGDAQVLRSLFDKNVVIVDKVTYDGISIHSRTIKDYLRLGKLEMANKLLGRFYRIEGNVIKGQGLGKKELVPTINLEVKSYQLPQEGVYATRTKINRQWLNSITFLGHRESTDNSYAVETHILDISLKETQGDIDIEFIRLIRKNKKFNNLNALKEQIKKDIDKAKNIHNMAVSR